MRRIVVLLSSTVAGVLLVCGVGLLNAAKPAEATFPGKNGKIAYMDSDGHDREIYTISPGGERRFNVTNNNANDYEPSYSPTGKRIAYEGSDRKGSDVYTINAGGGAKFQVTNNDTIERSPSYSPSSKKIVYADLDGIYTINVRGGSRSKVTNITLVDPEIIVGVSPSWGSR